MKNITNAELIRRLAAMMLEATMPGGDYQNSPNVNEGEWEINELFTELLMNN